MIWKRKKAKAPKILTEEEIQEKLYGAYTRPKEDRSAKAQDEAREKLEREKEAEILKSKEAREKLEREKEAEALKKKEAEEGLRSLRAEFERLQTELARADKEKISLEKRLAKALATREAKAQAPPKITIASSKTIFNLSPKLIISILVLLLVVLASFRLIYLKTKPGQIEEKPTLTTKKKSVVTKPYTIQICVYEKEDDAERLVSDLKKKGYPAWLSRTTSPKGKIQYNIYIGRFATDKEASDLLGSLLSKEEFKKFKDSFVRLH